MKKIILSFAAALFVSLAAVAQESQNEARPQGKKFDKTEFVKKRTDMTVKQYGLNETQARQLLDLNTKYADIMVPGPRGHRHGMRPGHGPKQQKDSLRQRPQKPRSDADTGATSQEGKQRPELSDEQKAQMKANREQREADQKAYDVELQKILTPEQYQQYQADMKKRHQGGKRGHDKK